MPHIVLEDKRQICVLGICTFTTAAKYCFLWWPLPGVGKRPGCRHRLRQRLCRRGVPGPATEAVLLESQRTGVPRPGEATREAVVLGTWEADGLDSDSSGRLG